MADLEKMKMQPSQLFKTEYGYLVNRLESYYVKKLDGIEQIKAELANWDEEAKKAIISVLIDRLHGFDDIDDLQRYKLLGGTA